MLEIIEDSALSKVRQLAKYLDVSLVESYGVAVLRLDNKKGKGYISYFSIIPGLSLVVFNITFYEKLVIHKKIIEDQIIDFYYVLNGIFKHQFSDMDSIRKVDKNRNLITISNSNSTSSITFLENIKIEVSDIVINNQLLPRGTTNYIRQLERNVKELVQKVGETAPFYYESLIDPIPAEYAQILINNKKMDVMGRLMTEGAAINMLFSQLKNYEKETSENKIYLPTKLKDEDLLKCTKIGDYIKKYINRRVTITELSKHFLISTKKLQNGIQFLYGDTVNRYISNIKLTHAKELLQKSDLSISEICKICGYPSPSYLSKKFFERYHFLPKDYKSSFQNKNALFEISYRSVASPSMTPEDVKQIVEKAISFNKIHNITGCLIYHNQTFFQILEGAKEEVMRLYYQITQDPRHSSLVIVWKGVKFVRNFSMWNMALVTDNGNLRVTYEDNTEHQDLGNIMNNLDSSKAISDILWKRIHKVIETRSTAPPGV
ncbi:BLUF domain-containing protein [Aquimarina sp. ERC-38]|uniref:BLUF domain-containing protein n=1 Tax=Aquimarina sp. ERC-38 TaxID=2949996 RepID=UPI0022483E50|nr:BLUF domain-containing protein [Aquimarina sp. ERC-38]UZO79580.1 BLUF domain-containing protein [Aquimarina sp. ERC-38]